MRVLFILKKTVYDYADAGYCDDHAGGLLNSCRFIVDMLNQNGVAAKIAVVTDNNDIDREVTAYQPDVAIIEALWVVPEKFDILSQLHPTVTWVVRLHSDLPFLSSDGIAFLWIKGYLDRNVYVATNKQRTQDDLVRVFGDEGGFVHLPNYYPVTKPSVKPILTGLNIGCFGAIRPLKNQLVQAVAAVEYADQTSQTLNFHMNGTRTESGGNAILKNIQSMFAETNHTLVLHPWLPHNEFLMLMAQMDLALAVSFSETFCITAADAVNVGVPLVCSDQIPWADSSSVVEDPTDTGEIRGKMTRLLRSDFLSNLFNLRNLKGYSKRSTKTWLSVLDEISKYDYT
jgi:hypothetical protein